MGATDNPEPIPKLYQNSNLQLQNTEVICRPQLQYLWPL